MSVLRTTARALTASALLVGTLAAPLFAHTASAASVPASTLPAPAIASLNWLAAELADGGGATGQAHVLGQTLDFGDGSGPNFFPDWGLTADAVMDLTLSGVQPTEATASLDNIQGHASDYVTGGSPDDRFAGALGKSLLLAEIAGRNPHAFGGFDLEQELRARLQTTGIKAGRFTDDAKFGDPKADSSDFSNGFGQAISMLALTRTHDGVPASAIAFLLDQQCPDGGFRTAYDAAAPAASTRGCTADSQTDPDGTAIALDVLLDVPAAPGVAPAIVKATAKLVALQDATTGGFANGGATPSLNANTTGLAGQALRSAGLGAAADKAAAFVTTLQLTATPAAAGIAPAAVPGPDLGAFAFNVAAHTAAQAAGIAAAARDTFHRATAQGVLAFGITPFGVAAILPPPAPTTTTTVAPTTTTTVVGATTTTAAGATTTTVVGATTTTTTKAATHLPATGSNVGNVALAALALLAAGAIVRRSARVEADRSRS